MYSSNRNEALGSERLTMEQREGTETPEKTDEMGIRACQMGWILVSTERYVSKKLRGNRMITFKYLNGQPVKEELDV